MNVSLNGNEILFIFLLLHLPKHNSYLRVCPLAKNVIFSTNTFTKAYFLFSHKRAGSYQKALGMLQDPKKGQKNRILIKDKPSWLCLRKNTLLWCRCCEWNVIDDFFIFKQHTSSQHSSKDELVNYFRANLKRIMGKTYWF